MCFIRFKAKAQEIQEQLDLANSKITSLEKTRHRLQQELEDAQIDAERVCILWLIVLRGNIDILGVQISIRCFS